MRDLARDPLSMIIIGVAGQGNVVTSHLVCNALVEQGYVVTFGQSYPAQQRGGSVINYIRISKDRPWSPIVPEGRADVIVGMEPVEAMRMLTRYGNPDVVTMVNPRPLQPMDIAGQEGGYPDIDQLLASIRAMSGKTYIVPATDEAQKLGNAIMANVVLVGALVGADILPLDREVMAPVLRERFPKAFELNMSAFDRGAELVAAGTV